MSTLANKLAGKSNETPPTLNVPEGTEEPVVGGEFPAELSEQIVQTALAEAASYEAPEGSYENVRLHSVCLPNGTRVKPNQFGFYEAPKGELKDLLEYYAEKGLVRLVGKLLG